MLGGKLFHCHLASKWYTFRVSFTVGFNRIESYHSVNNPASGKVMQKAGMKLEGLAEQLQPPCNPRT